MAGTLLLLSIAAIALPMVARAEDIGRDRVDISATPWQAVGQVNTAAYGRCTGVLVGPRLAVTAAHCLFNRATNRFLQPASVHLVLGYDRGSYAFRTVATEIRMDPAQDGTRSRETASRDWAVLVLADPAPPSIAPMAVAADRPELGGTLDAAGFGRDRAFALTAAQGCRYLGTADRDLIAVRCPVVPGYSGGPMINASGELVGITVATATSGDGDVALAVANGAWAAAAGR